MNARQVAALRKLVKAARGRFSVEAMAGDHAHQLAFMRDRSQWLHVMCARQSGKSWGDLGILLDNALEAPGCKGLFLGLKGTGVREGAWQDWKTLLDTWHIEREDTEQPMLSVFPNGSRVKFGGTDDMEHIRIHLGRRLDHGVVIIDEAQDQKDGVLTYLVRQLLPPMLTPTSRVILSGVLPDVEAGMFYSLAAAKPLADAPELRHSKGFSHHEWGRAANVHTPEAMEQLRETMERFSLTEDDPQIARDWFLRRVWDRAATAYGYDPARNAYTATEPDWLTDALEEIRLEIAETYPTRRDLLPLYQRTAATTEGDARFGIMAAVPHPDIETVSASIDQGRGDRLSLSATGWGRNYRGVQHLFEFSSPRNANLTLGQLKPVMRLVQFRYGPVHWSMDGTVNEVDTFQLDCGIPAIRAPDKRDMPGQVRRTKGLLQETLLAIMAGSAAEQDMIKAKWDLDARLRREFKWSTAWHPDPSESLRYTTTPYFDQFVPKKPEQTPEQAMFERHRARQAVPQRDRDADWLGLGDYDDAI